MLSELKCAVVIVLLSLALLAVDAQARSQPPIGILTWTPPTNREYIILGERRNGVKLNKADISHFNMYRDGVLVIRHKAWARNTGIYQKGCYTLTTVDSKGRESAHSDKRCF